MWLRNKKGRDKWQGKAPDFLGAFLNLGHFLGNPCKSLFSVPTQFSARDYSRGPSPEQKAESNTDLSWEVLWPPGPATGRSPSLPSLWTGTHTHSVSWHLELGKVSGRFPVLIVTDPGTTRESDGDPIGRVSLRPGELSPRDFPHSSFLLGVVAG